MTRKELSAKLQEYNKDQAHRRLLDAVNSFTGAEQNGSREEVRAAAIELETATRISQKLLCPEKLR